MQEKDPRKFDTEELVGKYFREQERRPEGPGVGSSRAGAFDGKKVYKNILIAIGQRKLPVRRFAITWQVAASVSLLLCLSVLGYQYRHAILNRLFPDRMLVKEAEWGEIKIVTLSDGTKIWLNAGSRLTYPAAFHGNKREVSLDGEAYFDVAHNASAPFVVHSGHVTTRVLGTRFNISAYQGERNIIVSVDQGKVGVSADEDDPVRDVLLVMPRQQAVYNKLTRALVRDESAALQDPASWKEGKLIYRNAPLPEIIDDIQRMYNVEIRTGNGVRNCVISADFNHDPLSKVLQILAELVNGDIEEQDGKYLLTGAGCPKHL